VLAGSAGTSGRCGVSWRYLRHYDKSTMLGLPAVRRGTREGGDRAGQGWVEGWGQGGWTDLRQLTEEVKI